MRIRSFQLNTWSPFPLFRDILLQGVLDHINNVLPQYRHELETMGRAADSEFKIIVRWMCPDQEVVVGCIGVPNCCG